MRLLLKFLRAVVIWVGPFLVLLLMVLAGLGYWVFSTPAGTRWALVLATGQLGGEVAGVQGTLREGVQVGRFDLFTPDFDLQLRQFKLEVNWSGLPERRVHIRELSAGSVVADVRTPDTSEPAAPFEMPVLPVSIALDRLAVDQLRVTLNNEPLPVTVHDLSTAVAVGPQGVSLALASLTLKHTDLRVALQGQAQVHALAAPWPFTVSLHAQAQAAHTDSPLCVRQHVPSLPASGGEGCEIVLDAQAQGDLDFLTLTALGQGQGLHLDAALALRPQAVIPVQSAQVALTLPDASSLKAAVDWTSLEHETARRDRVHGTLDLQALNLGGLLAGAGLPDALLTLQSRFDVVLHDQKEPVSLSFEATIDKNSRWNKEPLQGTLALVADNPVAGAQPEPDWSQLVHVLQIPRFDTDLTLGRNHIKTSGALGAPDARLALDISAPVLAAFWPGLPGGVRVQGDIAGNSQAHRLDLKTVYTPPGSRSETVGAAPTDLQVQAQGQWLQAPVADEGWQGRINLLSVRHAAFGVRTAAAVPVRFFMTPADGAPQWWVDATRVDLLLRDQRLFTLDHTRSQGRADHWATQGAIRQVSVSPALVEQVQKALGLHQAAEASGERGGIRVRGDQRARQWAMDLGLDWDLRFAGALDGAINLRRIAGDVMVPAEPPFALGLTQLELGVRARPAQGGNSQLNASLALATREMGRLSVKADTVLRHTREKGFLLDPADLIRADVDAAIDDLGWTRLVLGDAVELGGKLVADLQVQGRVDGRWSGSGDIRGDNLRVVSLDQGVRLLNGTLRARLRDERLLLDSLTFPAVLRVTPKEWRTAEWVSQNPAAKGGSLTLSGDWHLMDSEGTIRIKPYRYPILQRSDRYAMISGEIAIKAALPVIDINGQITADAGWFDLDMLGGIPTLDSDVIVLKPGEKTVPPPPVPSEISMVLKVDLGPRFYLTGYGVNSGLVGDMTLTMGQGKLTALGALRTRGGAIEAYGQRLQLRRGTVTFQGDVTSPVLNIEALRTGLQVEAGVRVSGTARRPRIDLVSYPDVSEIEKLTWLLLGHGPNDSGGDVALLFSVGSSFLSDGEPFYRKFGIDEVSMRSGNLGAAGSILPAESVVSRMDSGPSAVENRFISVSKRLASGFTVGVHQALNDTGTVGRASYRLAQGLNAELTAGTVNGLALVYRWFSRD